MIKRILRRFFVCAALPALFCIGCTGNEPQASIEITNGDCTGTIYASDLSVAGGAVVRLIPERYDPHDPVTGTIDSTITDKDGRYSFFVNRPDIYTILAEKDGASSITQSVPLQPEASVVVNDTLRQPGTLAGKVILSGGEDARVVIILVRGTDYYFTPSDSAGTFTSPPLPAGTFTMQMIVPGSERYTNLDTVVTIVSGETTELLAALGSAYAPLVNGLTVKNDSVTMFATISWQPADTSHSWHCRCNYECAVKPQK